MSINYKPSQFELFPGSPGSSQDAQKPRYLFADLTLSLENIILVGIVLLMILLFTFSLGVEQGKQLARTQISSQAVVAASPAQRQPRALIKDGKKTGVDPAVLPNASLSKGVPVKAKEQKQPISVQAPIKIEQEIPDNAFTIQVASFKSEKFARQEVELLKKKGYDSTVLTKGSYSIVCVGKFAQMDQAKSFINRFKNKNKEYKDCLVRRM